METWKEILNLYRLEGATQNEGRMLGDKEVKVDSRTRWTL